MYIGKSVTELDGNGKFLGHRFIIDNNYRIVNIRERCKYCGKWFSSQVVLLPNETIDNFKKPQHCGNSACEYFHQRFLKHQARKMEVDKDLKGYFDNPEVVKNILVKTKNLWE